MLLLGFGERSKSAGAVRIVRRRAAELNLDWSHFRGKRRWSDTQLRQAVAECHSWEALLSTLGLSAKSGNIESHIKSHAVRLGLDTSHLNRLSHNGRQPAEPVAEVSELAARLDLLRVAAGTLAATWFMLRGCTVSFPAEPARYDRRGHDDVPDTQPGDRGAGWHLAPDLPEIHRRERPGVAWDWRGRRRGWDASLGVKWLHQAEMISRERY